jgi:hypothetical protein
MPTAARLFGLIERVRGERSGENFRDCITKRQSRGRTAPVKPL